MNQNYKVSVHTFEKQNPTFLKTQRFLKWKALHLCWLGNTLFSEKPDSNRREKGEQTSKCTKIKL